MSLEPSASDVSARSFDLNSAAVVHQEEPDSSLGESRKFCDVGTGDDLGGGLRPEDENIREVEGNERIGDDAHLDAAPPPTSAHPAPPPLLPQ